ELEYFCQGAQALSDLEFWLEQRKQFYQSLQIDMTKIRFREHAADELAHYSSRCLDVEYEFPFGWKELEGIAYRGDYDLSRHTQFSGKDLAVFDEATKQSFMPHVVECSVGVDRLFFTLLFDAYHEDILDGETRVVLKLAPEIAPVKAAILPLQKQLNAPAELLYKQLSLSTDYNLDLDSSGSIGKRYRRQDEIGTPLCITYDFESETDQSVTVRERDTMMQTRVKIAELKKHLDQVLRKN
ncbi:MAG TPA: His/Gly/Thr/Pro-type tRNA ligase C-terminal domain-containing protein, partial [Candidatus Babeliales bacterium]|nr:His/Gly/Thr/Pro-type tRNA ligase C-terminal domain-containing protein [Candidatus Babeliales bacterium]